MSGPWERYAAPSADEAAPWAKYRPTPAVADAPSADDFLGAGPDAAAGPNWSARLAGGRGASRRPPPRPVSVLQDVVLPEPQFNEQAAARDSIRANVEIAPPTRTKLTPRTPTRPMDPASDLPMLAKGAELARLQAVKALGGGTQFLGDILPGDAGEAVAQFGANAARVAGQRAEPLTAPTGPVEGFAPGSVVNDLQRVTPGAISSVLTMAGTGGAFGVGRMLSGLAGLTAGQEYAEGRAAGLDVMPAATRAGLQALFEYGGERLGGMDRVADSLGAVMRGSGAADVAGRALTGAALREVPSEEFTTVGQWLVDKAPGIGLNQDSTAEDLRAQMKDTALASLVTSGMVGGPGVVMQARARPTVDPAALEALQLRQDSEPTTAGPLAALRLARAIEQDSQAFADARPPVVVQQPVARAVGAPVAPSVAPEPQRAVPPALPYDPSVRPAEVMVAGANGEVRPMTADEFLAAEDTIRKGEETGLTPDVRRAQDARSEPEPVRETPDLVRRLLDAGWKPPEETDAKQAPAAVADPAAAPDAQPAPDGQQGARVAAVPGDAGAGRADAGRADPALTGAIERDLEALYQQDVKEAIRSRLGIVNPDTSEGAAMRYAQSPLIRGIADAGGINVTERSDTGIDRNRATRGRVMPNPINVAGKPLFRQRSADPNERQPLRGDALVEHLVQGGYLTEQDVAEADANGAGGSEELAWDIVRRELTSPGSVKPAAERGAQMADQVQRRAQDDLHQQARAIGFDVSGLDDAQVAGALRRIERRRAEASARSARWEAAEEARLEREAIQAEAANELADLDALDAPWLEGQNVSLADAMMALGFDPQEIQDAQREADRRGAQAIAEPAAGATPRAGAADEAGASRPAGAVLESYTPAEVEARERAAREAGRADERQRQEQDQRAQADAERGEFRLTGSDRPADVAAAGGQEGLFSRREPGTSTAASMRTELQGRFGDIIDRLENRGFLKLWDSTDDYNAAGQASKLPADARGVQGMFHNGVAHLFGDGVERGNAVAVLLHEVGEHASMKAMLGDRYKDLVRRAYQLVREGDETAEMALMRIPEDTAAKHQDSELLAYLIEETASREAKASPAARSILRDAIAAIRAWFYQTGFAKNLERYGVRLELTPKDIAALAVRAVRWQAEQGQERAQPDGEPAMASESERYAAGRALTKEQRKQVLATLVDVYKAKRAPKEFKGMDRNGNERYGYAHSPDLFERSDITGAMVRYHVTLPDGRIAHPSELFPNYTQADIDRAMIQQEADERLEAESQAMAERRAEKYAAATPEAAEASFLQRNAGFEMRDWRTGKSRSFVHFEKGGKFFAVTDDDVAHMARLQRAGWKRRGTDDAAPPDDQPARDGDQMALFSRRNPAAQAANVFGTAPQPQPAANLGAQPWTVAEPGTWDNTVRAIQNNKIDLKRVRDAIEQQFGRMHETNDAYLAEELYHGRVAARVEKLHREQVEPILRKIAVAGKDKGVTLDDVNRYLHALHAPERNAAMAAINPGMANNQALSGMSDADAAQAIAAFRQAGKEPALAAIAKDVHQLLADTRTALVADGLEEAGVIQAWEQAYQNYVPLHRDVEDRPRRGQGFSVRGPETKRAVGSNREAVNILANVVTQAETAAIRAEKAEVGRTLLAMAEQYPNPDFWKVDTPPTKPRVNPHTGLVERSAVDPLYQTADNVVMVKDFGAVRFIVFNKDNARALEVAKAMKNLEVAPINRLLEFAGKGTRFMASLLTQRNPEFWLTNFARDIQGSMLQMSGTDAEGLQGKVMGNLPKAMAGMRDAVRGTGSGQWARYAQELRDAGGTTGYMQMFENSDVRMKDLQREVDRMNQGKADPRRVFRQVIDFIDDYNEVIENGMRLAVFQAARDAGVSTARAASIAKNVTVNFNRKGNLTPTVNSLYMFFNAGIQGTARLAQAVTTSNTARIAVGSMAATAFIMDIVNRALAGEDDETKRNRYDLIPEHEKARNWIFMNPARPGEYVKVPLPIGFNVFHNAGRLMADAMFRKDPRNAAEYGLSFAASVLDAFSPLGTFGSVGQLIAPTLADPVLQVAENRNFAGSPVYKSDDRGFGKTDPKPAYTRHFDSTPDAWKKASKVLNDITGGDKVKPGLVDVEPDLLRFVYTTLTGGPGRALDRTVDAVQANARGEKVAPARYPLVSRFYGSNDDRQRDAAYYTDLKRANDAKAQFDYFTKSGRRDLALEAIKRLGDGDVAKGRRLIAEAERAKKDDRAINRQLRQLAERQADGADVTEQISALKARKRAGHHRVLSSTAEEDDE